MNVGETISELIASGEMNSEARNLIKAGWSFGAGEPPQGRTLARPVAEGHAGVLEYIGHPHGKPCHVPHDHAIHRYCRHGAWHKLKPWHKLQPSSLSWKRAAELASLDRVCACPVRLIVSEFHPVSAADEMRRAWERGMNEWLDSYLSQQPDCSCIPLLRLGTVLGTNGQATDALAVLIHDGAVCRVRSEPIETSVSG